MDLTAAVGLEPAESLRQLGAGLPGVGFDFEQQTPLGEPVGGQAHSFQAHLAHPGCVQEAGQLSADPGISKGERIDLCWIRSLTTVWQPPSGNVPQSGSWQDNTNLGGSPGESPQQSSLNLSAQVFTHRVFREQFRLQQQQFDGGGDFQDRYRRSTPVQDAWSNSNSSSAVISSGGSLIQTTAGCCKRQTDRRLLHPQQPKDTWHQNLFAVDKHREHPREAQVLRSHQSARDSLQDLTSFCKDMPS
jgi:hypothetical protein